MGPREKAVSVRNTTQWPIDVFVAHSVLQAQPPSLGSAPGAKYTQYQYPASTAYYQQGLQSNDQMTFTTAYETSQDAMDDWYVWVKAYAPPAQKAFSTDGTALRPSLPFKIQDSGDFSIIIGWDDGGGDEEPAPTLSMTAGLTSRLKDDKGSGPWPIKRKSVAALTPEERAAYINAVLALKKEKSRIIPPTRSRYDDYVLVHMMTMSKIELKVPPRVHPEIFVDNSQIEKFIDSNRWAHIGPEFLPWHREYLRQFERDLIEQIRQAQPDWPDTAARNGYALGIPFWNWSVDWPWLDDFMGGNGEKGFGSVGTGPFDAKKGNWPLTLSNDKAVELVRGCGVWMPALPTAEEVAATLDQNVYDADPWNKGAVSFRNSLEGWFRPPNVERQPDEVSNLQVGMHNLVHCWVSGGKVEVINGNKTADVAHAGTMFPMSSPNEPIFFLHHCNIDRLWMDWQARHSGAKPYLPEKSIIRPDGGMVLGLDDNMTFTEPPFSAPWTDAPATPGQVVDHLALNYFFEEPQVTLQPYLWATNQSGDGAISVSSYEFKPVDDKIRPSFQSWQWQALGESIDIGVVSLDGTRTPMPPALVQFQDRMYVAFISQNGVVEVASKPLVWKNEAPNTWTLQSFGQDSKPLTVLPVSLASFKGKLYAAFLSSNSEIVVYSFDGEKWAGPVTIGQLARSMPSLAASDDQLYAVFAARDTPAENGTM